MSAGGFVVRRVTSRGQDLTASEFSIAGNSALVGRDALCEVPLADDAGVSRRHAFIERTAQGGFRIVDLGSVNGVWIDERRVAEGQLTPGQQFRVGDSVLECRFDTTPGPEAPAGTVARPAGPEPAVPEGPPGLAQAGEPIAISDRSATLLDDADCVYYVAAGQIDLFTVTIDEGRALEGRSHFATVTAGDAVFGMDPGHARGSLMLAIGTPGNELLRRIPLTELQGLARQSDLATVIASMVDAWLMVAGARLKTDLPAPPEAGVPLRRANVTSLAPGQRARAADGVVWIPVASGGLTFVGLQALAPAQPAARFPLTPEIWVEAGAPLAEALTLDPVDTRALLASGQLWTSLAQFQDALCACLGAVKRRSAVDESARLDLKARAAELARNLAFDILADVMADRPDEAAPAGRTSGELAPILEACRLVGGSVGLDVRAPADLPGERTFQEHVAAIATASGFRTRLVALRGQWWQTDGGALLGHTLEGAPVALLPRGPRAYACVDVTAGTEQPVTAAQAATLATFAFSFYRPLPAGHLRPLDLMRFGIRGVGADVWALLGIGLLVGALGAVIPLFSGQIIDRAIPQGERGLLVQLGIGVFLVTIASAALSIVKSVAIVRVESRVDYVLQSAVWLRLLALPAGFFRQFGSGDLAERAAGIDAIRRLMSSSGIAGLLGLVNAVAYLALMVYLSPALAAIGVAVSLMLAAFSTLGNYLLLRTQRQEIDLRGQIASLLMQLIAGVAKVRMSGAENHAFRVWAQKFAEQKRLAFSLGRLQNVLFTLAAGFQVLAPLAIFAAIYRMQSGAAAADPRLTTGQFVAFYAAFGTFANATSELSNTSLNLLAIVPFYERLRPILDAAPESDGGKAHPGRLHGEISVSRLRFRYAADGPWVLQDVSLTIRPGEFVALVGPSGCGKSTLLRLMLGFEQPSSGAVYYDGLDLAQLDPRGLRQQLGVVLQESRLMPTDIFRNIVGDSSRTVNEAWTAAEQAGLADDIRQMPMGLHTVVSEGGGTFSGGQSQRLLIARALVAKPRIVFFDEATSALDNRAQATVTSSLKQLEATRVVIAHRLSTLVDADRIIFLDDGLIQEEGTYRDLMAKGGRFAELARRQLA